MGQWEEGNVFQRSVDSRPKEKRFVFFEGPPSANGKPGIHHVMARALKDLFCRYRTLKGERVERKAGWDTHGLPVELGVEKALGITKEDIGKKISVEEYNTACRESVMQYTQEWNDLTRQMGYWVDMDAPYVTYQPKYMESVWWLLSQMHPFFSSKRPNVPEDHPKSMLVEPQMSKPIDKPISLMTGTLMRLPVHHKNPPIMATGSNGGYPRAALTMLPATQIAEQRIHWKNTPSPVSNFFTGTKLLPKKRKRIKNPQRK